jgi:hypothetical protein
MRIAILGWGSLVWDKRDLSIRGRFKTGGPRLPLEFSRKSSDGRLTLIIDESHGMPSVPTRYAISRFHHLEDAICDLQHREGAQSKDIGLMSTGGGEQRPPQSKVAEKAIADWLKRNQETIDVVIWTNLGPNKNFSFSCEVAERYLKSLRGVCREKAIEYLVRAPKEVKTPLRNRMIQWLKKS